MAIFKSRKEKFEARVKQVEQMSDEEYNKYKQTNFAHKKKVATGWLIGSIAVSALLLGLLAVTGAMWGWAVYKIAFALTATVVGGTASSLTSAFFRRHYKRELKVQKLVKERDNAKTIKGRALDTQKQTQLDGKIAKNVNKLQNARKITGREAQDYKGVDKAVATKAKTSAIDKKKVVKEFFQNEVAGIKSKRDAVTFAVQNEWSYYKDNERANYQNDDACQGKIEVLFVEYDDNGQAVCDDKNNLQYKESFAVNSKSDIDLAKSNAIIYDNLAKQDIDFPVQIRTTVGDKVNVTTYKTKTELSEARDSAIASTAEYLKNHEIETPQKETKTENGETYTINFDGQDQTLTQTYSK